MQAKSRFVFFSFMGLSILDQKCQRIKSVCHWFTPSCLSNPANRNLVWPLRQYLPTFPILATLSVTPYMMVVCPRSRFRWGEGLACVQIIPVFIATDWALTVKLLGIVNIYNFFSELYFYVCVFLYCLLW